MRSLVVHCDHKVHVSLLERVLLDSPMSWTPRHVQSTYSQPSFSNSTVPPGTEVGYEQWTENECAD